MTADRLRQIHNVTDNYFFWQGLRWIPLGAAMLGYAVMRSVHAGSHTTAREWIGLLMFGKPPTFATLIKWARMA